MSITTPSFVCQLDVTKQLHAEINAFKLFQGGLTSMSPYPYIAITAIQRLAGYQRLYFLKKYVLKLKVSAQQILLTVYITH